MLPTIVRISMITLNPSAIPLVLLDLPSSVSLSLGSQAVTNLQPVLAGPLPKSIPPLPVQACLKAFMTLSKNPSDSIHCCHGRFEEISGATGWKGWAPQTWYSWMTKSEGKGQSSLSMSRAIVLP